MLLLDSSLYDSVLTGFVAGTGHVTFKDERRLDFIKLLEQTVILTGIKYTCLWSGNCKHIFHLF